MMPFSFVLVPPEDTLVRSSDPTQTRACFMFSPSDLAVMLMLLNEVQDKSDAQRAQLVSMVIGEYLDQVITLLTDAERQTIMRSWDGQE